MRETQIVERIRHMAGQGHRDRPLVKTIGDDCAILRPKANEDLVFTSDFVLEGRHFTLDTHKASDIGHKSLARSLSDLAAMGAEPVFCLISLAVPAQRSASWIAQFYKGLLMLANRYRVTLAGGDLARFDKVVADVTCCGRVPRGKALLRSGARPGDRIYVTGDLGRPWQSHFRPEPRIAAGLALRRLGVSACMDLSDGLALDLHRLCLESCVSAETSDLPIAHGASLHNALHGGEDYELLFTAAPNKRIPKQIAGIPVTAIGTITTGHSGQIKLNGRRLKPVGFDHFVK